MLVNDYNNKGQLIHLFHESLHCHKDDQINKTVESTLMSIFLPFFMLEMA